MVSSSRQAIACILLIFGTALYLQAQTIPSTKDSTASISGKVTLKGKGVPGITVMAMDPTSRGGSERSRHRAVTDVEGNYRISNLPQGTYRVTPHALAFVLENEDVTVPLVVSAGETVEGINLVLVRGGVITGKVTDSEGQPLVDENINLTPADEQRGHMTMHVHGIQTDDRGIYRAFGLREGKYKVSVGKSYYGRPGAPRHSHRLTFHPSTTEMDKATVIEVSEGSEIKNVDIVRVDRDPVGFKVTGQIIDGNTGKPLPNTVYGVSQKFGDGGSSSTSGARSNANGEFKLENILPGKYTIYIQPPPGSDMRANPVPFEVTDRELTGLVIRTVKGATLSGVVVFDGSDGRPVVGQPGQLHIFAWVESSDADDHHNAVSASLKPDGSFSISGLRSGTAHISLGSMYSDGSSGFGIVRLERSGVVQPSGINLKDGEHVGGLRLILKPSTAAIRGQVKIEDGELPPASRMSVGVVLLDELSPNATKRYRSDAVDSRGRFYLDGLAAGRYEVRVEVFLSNQHHTGIVSKQEVTLADNTVSEVVLTVKMKANPAPDDDDP